jgi:hypothetical protein
MAYSGVHGGNLLNLAVFAFAIEDMNARDDRIRVASS